MWATIVSLAAAGFAGIIALLIPRMPYADEILQTTATVGGYSLLATILAVIVERARSRRLRILSAVGIALALIAGAIIIVEIWADRLLSLFIEDENAFRTVGTATTLAIAIAHFGLYAPARLVGTGRVLKIATVVTASTFALLLCVIYWTEPSQEWIARSMGALGILAVMGSAITPIVWKMQSLRRRDHATPTLHPNLTIHLRCPRCGLEQSVPLRKAKCSRCKLEIRVEVEEPRCACGYELLGLTSDTCPECGRPIPEEDRWALLTKQTT